MDLPFTLEDVIKAAETPAYKVRNVYIYGSRIYGTARENSDYDIIVVASSLLAHTEKKVKVGDTLLNIHIITPDIFLADLKNHHNKELECLFAPEWARLQEKVVLSTEINQKKLIQKTLAQSHESWYKAKRKIKDYDFPRGLKSLFHSIKMLMFSIQILEHGKIVDYSVANYLYPEITESDEIDWSYFKEKYLPFKVELEEKLKSYVPAE